MICVHVVARRLLIIFLYVCFLKCYYLSSSTERHFILWTIQLCRFCVLRSVTTCRFMHERCLRACSISVVDSVWRNWPASSDGVVMFVRQDSRITDAANEAKDNLKYLSTLDKFFSPLSRSDPVTSNAYFHYWLLLLILSYRVNRRCYHVYNKKQWIPSFGR